MTTPTACPPESVPADEVDFAAAESADARRREAHAETGRSRRAQLEVGVAERPGRERAEVDRLAGLRNLEVLAVVAAVVIGIAVEGRRGGVIAAVRRCGR